MVAKYSFGFLTFFFLIVQIAFSQFCKVVPTPGQIAFENSLTQTFPSHSIDPVKKELSIHLHLVANSNYEYYPGAAYVYDALDRLNYAFRRSGIQFKYCEIDSIENYKYLDFSIDYEVPEMKTLHYHAGVINVFVVWNVWINTPSNATEGWAFFPGEEDIIVITSASFLGHGLTHQMGHFFGLYHTFETEFGYELVDGSNAYTTGDLISDTPADKYLAMNGCSPGITLFDANGDKYHHPTDNIMSNAVGCRCVFTIEQLNKMIYVLKNHRAYLK